MRAGFAVPCLLAAALAGGLAAAQEEAPLTEEQQDQKKLERLQEPWPDAEKLEKEQAEAEALPLFQSHAPLQLRLTADFEEVFDDREVDSPRRYRGTLSFGEPEEGEEPLEVQLGTRGNLRLDEAVCRFPPLKVWFPKKKTRGTPFEEQGSLKLVTHCRNGGDYEQRVLEEALAYRFANLVTPASFRIRLAQVSYVDSSDGDSLGTKWAFFIEDVDDVARRMQGRVAPLKGKLFHNLDPPSLLRLAVFQFAIANTDYSIYGLHNLRLVQDREGALRAVAYDFDVSGLVNPPYSRPARKLGITSLRDRLYRGPCRPLEQLEPILARFRPLREPVLALYDEEPLLDRRKRSEAKRFLEDFFDIIESPKRTKRFFVDRCEPQAGI